MMKRESGVEPLVQSNTPPMTKDGRAAPPWVKGGLNFPMSIANKTR